MSEMVDRVARAIAADECEVAFDELRDVGDGYWWGKDEFRSMARAAIAAMRDPTPQMIADTLPTTDTYKRSEIESAERLVEQALFILEPPTISLKDHARGKTVACSLVVDWRNMIDAALDPVSSPATT